jgi:Ca2+-binding EF-hand superfamily protein
LSHLVKSKRYAAINYQTLILLQAQQVGEVLRALGQNPTEADVRRLVQNTNKEGRVSFEMFLPILQTVSQKKITDTVDDFVEGLRHFDKVKGDEKEMFHLTKGIYMDMKC